MGLLPMLASPRVLTAYLLLNKMEGNILEEADNALDESTLQLPVRLVAVSFLPSYTLWSLVKDFTSEGNVDSFLKFNMLLGLMVDILLLSKVIYKQSSWLNFGVMIIVKEVFFGTFAAMSYFVGWWLVPCVNFAGLGVVVAVVVALVENGPIGSAQAKQGVIQAGESVRADPNYTCGCCLVRSYLIAVTVQPSMLRV